MSRQPNNDCRNLPATRRDTFLSPRIVAREAVKIVDDLHVDLHPAQIRRLVTRFINDGHTTLDELRVYVLAYADPTGETAVRHVMRERRGA